MQKHILSPWLIKANTFWTKKTSTGNPKKSNFTIILSLRTKCIKVLKESVKGISIYCMKPRDTTPKPTKLKILEIKLLGTSYKKLSERIDQRKWTFIIENEIEIYEVKKVVQQDTQTRVTLNTPAAPEGINLYF